MNHRTRVALFGILLAVAIAAILVAVLYTLWYPRQAPTVLKIVVAVLFVALLGEIWLLVAGRGQRFDEEGEWRDWQSETAAASRELLLRCTTCGNTFPVIDTGERPLRHTCPHCGRVGVLKEPAPADAPPGAPGP